MQAIIDEIEKFMVDLRYEQDVLLKGLIQEVEELSLELKNDHMDSQPYVVQCSECQCDLDFTKHIDGDADLHVTVEPCNCARSKR